MIIVKVCFKQDIVLLKTQNVSLTLTLSLNKYITPYLKQKMYFRAGRNLRKSIDVFPEKEISLWQFYKVFIDFKQMENTV